MKNEPIGALKTDNCPCAHKIYLIEQNHEENGRIEKEITYAPIIKSKTTGMVKKSGRMEKNISEAPIFDEKPGGRGKVVGA
ncbi:MAG: hypothetical protein ACI4FX_09845 [Agathobacter sp.]